MPKKSTAKKPITKKAMKKGSDKKPSPRLKPVSVEPTEKRPASTVASALDLFKRSVLIFRENYQVLGGLTLAYITARILIGGLPDQEVYQGAKDAFGSLQQGNWSGIIGSGAVIAGAFSGLFTPAYSEVQQLLISMIGIIFWLSLIWTMRQILAGNDIGIRTALYNCMTPLIPLTAVIAVLVLQLIPGALGAYLLSYLLTTPFSGYETVLFMIVAVLLMALSLYFLVHSSMALVIVTLPATYPIAALKSASLLVSGRRLRLLYKFLGLAVGIAVIWIAVSVPFLILEALSGGSISFIPILAEILSGFSLAVTTIYLYLLYRELL